MGSGASPGAFSNLVAQGNSDSLGCRITVDGEVKDERIVNEVERLHLLPGESAWRWHRAPRPDVGARPAPAFGADTVRVGRPGGRVEHRGTESGGRGQGAQRVPEHTGCAVAFRR